MNGIEFKRLRNKLGLTQEELAHILGLSSKHVISNIEIDTRKPGKLVAMILKYMSSLSEKQFDEFKNRLMDLSKDYDRKKSKEIGL